MYKGEMLFADRETKSAWSVSAVAALDGPLAGRRLRVISLILTTWQEWRRLHPDTRVLSADTPYKEHYKPLPPPRTALSRGLQRTLAHVDERLPAFEEILAVEVGDAHRAYPLAALDAAGGIVNEAIAGVPVVVLFDGRSRTASAFKRTLDGRTLEFGAAAGTGVARDAQTGSAWRVDGRAVTGPLAGRALEALAFHVGAWYSWAAYFPDTTIYGR